jgi:hypothetical protein
METRPTREFKTSGGHTLVLNGYITGAENWQIRQIYINGLKKEDGAVALEAEKKAYELVVASIDGKSEGVADAVLALPLPEYNQVVQEITLVTEGKKKSETPSLDTLRKVD